jgi:hypothetical protein
LTKFDLSSNDIRAEGGKALAAGLQGNQVITELNISGNDLGSNSDEDADTSGITALANIIPGMRALLVLSLKSNKLQAAGGKALAEGLKGNKVITELNIADNNLANNGDDMSGVIALADVIPDIGAISSANLLLNNIGVDQAEELVSILKEHPTLKSLCGITGNETELGMSGKMHGAGDAIMLVPDIIDNGAMTSLNLSNNALVSYLGDGKYDHSGEFHISCFHTQHQLFLNPLFSQALLPLPMSSLI